MEQQEAIPMEEVIRRQLRRERETRGFLQEHVAEEMVRLGFDWKRTTVSDVELGRRRLSIEELLGLAIVFAVPAIALLSPREETSVALTDRVALAHGNVVSLVTVGPAVEDPELAALLLERRRLQFELEMDKTHLAELQRSTDRLVVKVAHDEHRASEIARRLEVTGPLGFTVAEDVPAPADEKGGSKP